MQTGTATDILRISVCLNLEDDQVAELTRLLAQVSDWQELIGKTEKSGLSNILYSHIKQHDIVVPSDFARQLKALTVRHRRAHRTRTIAVIEILDQFKTARINTILLKGAALARVLYPAPEMRPMSDIDILVSTEDALNAQQALREIGYHASDQTAGYMFDHHHLPGATVHRDGILIYVEVHHDALSGDATSSIRFDNLTSAPIPFEIDNRTTAALGHIDMLRHLCHHTFEPIRKIKLGAITDIYAYARKYETDIDWDRLKREFPFVINTFHCLHYVTRLPYSLTSIIGVPTAPPPAGIGLGFVPLSETLDSRTSIIEKFKSIFFCSDWWLHVYYQIPPGESLFMVKLVRHPARIFSWLWRRLLARYRSRKIS